MPTVLRMAGFRFFFFSNEGDEPPHVHVERAEGYAKYWLQPEVRLAWSKRFRQRERTRLQRLVEQHQELFLEKWDEYFPDSV
ncbi:MAG: DUF4160 domain-containing protein [Gemmataceae bacterium]